LPQQVQVAAIKFWWNKQKSTTSGKYFEYFTEIISAFDF
jgi:hypothetical protein